VVPSFAHEERNMNIIDDAFHYACKVLRRATETGLDSFRKGPAVKPVLRKIN